MIASQPGAAGIGNNVGPGVSIVEHPDEIVLTPGMI